MTPAVLYKYCPPRGIDILHHLRLIITPPNRFNDPFELAPRMEEHLTREKAMEALTEPRIVEASYQDLIRANQFVGSFDQFKRWLLDNSEIFIEGFIRGYPESAAEFRRDHINTVSAEFGLLCLSEISDDILMWSHYTRNHAGFVIGLHTDHPFFADRPLLDVVYREERVLMGQSVKQNDPTREEQINALIRRKSPHWRYEREWRQVFVLKQCVPEEDKETGIMNYFKSFSGDLIAEVIIGCRTDIGLVNEIRGLLADGRFSQAKLSTYRMHDTEFSLVRE